jgi:hypothetical protein
MATKQERSLGKVGGQSLTALGEIDHAFVPRLQHYLAQAIHQGEALMANLAHRLPQAPDLPHSFFGVGAVITVIILIGTTATAGLANGQPKPAPIPRPLAPP